MRQITTCIDCKERHTACHDSCEKYISQKNEILKERNEIKKKKLADKQYRGYAVSLADKIKHTGRL